MPPRSNSAPAPKLAQVIKAAQKKYGIRIGPLNSAALEIESFSTGIIGLDHIIGVGGLPRGRLVELYGPPSSGKTTTALMAAASAQRQGLTVAFFDHEQAIDVNYCAALGLDTDAESFIYAAPDFLEQGGNIARDLIATGEVGVAIFDSVAAMLPEKELLAETGKSTFALQAKTMSQLCKQLVPLAANTGTLVIFLNHLQEIIDSSPMGQKLAASGVQRKSTPGGKALKFYASVRVEFKPVGGVREKVRDELTNEMVDAVTQNKVEVSVVKNKVAPPFKKVELRTVFGQGFSRAHAALSVVTAFKLGIKKEAGGVYRFTDQALAPKDMDVTSSSNWKRGETSLIQEMDADAEWLTRVEDRAREHLSATSNGAKLTEADLPAVGDNGSDEFAEVDDAAEGQEDQPDVNVDEILA
jgi:recombination protein RecA